VGNLQEVYKRGALVALRGLLPA